MVELATEGPSGDPLPAGGAGVGAARSWNGWSGMQAHCARRARAAAPGGRWRPRSRACTTASSASRLAGQANAILVDRSLDEHAISAASQISDDGQGAADRARRFASAEIGVDRQPARIERCPGRSRCPSSSGRERSSTRLAAPRRGAHPRGRLQRRAPIAPGLRERRTGDRATFSSPAPVQEAASRCGLRSGGDSNARVLSDHAPVERLIATP